MTSSSSSKTIVAIIVDIRMQLVDGAAERQVGRAHLEAIRGGLRHLFDLHCMSGRVENPLLIVVCRAHPDDCETVLTWPFTLHSAYEAVRWLDELLDSDLTLSSSFEVANSAGAALDEVARHPNVSKLFVFSPHWNQFLHRINVEIPWKFFALRCSDVARAEQDFADVVSKRNVQHRAELITQCPDVYDDLFKEIRASLVVPVRCVLSLDAMLAHTGDDRGPPMQFSFRSQSYLDRLRLPEPEQRCSCHHLSIGDINRSNRLSSVQIGSDFFDDHSPMVAATPAGELFFSAECFVAADELSESKSSAPMMIGWLNEPSELYEALRQHIDEHGLAIVAALTNSVPLTQRRRRFVMTSGTSSVEPFEFILIRELISVDELLYTSPLIIASPPVVVEPIIEAWLSSLPIMTASGSFLAHSGSYHEAMARVVQSTQPLQPPAEASPISRFGRR